MQTRKGLPILFSLMCGVVMIFMVYWIVGNFLISLPCGLLMMLCTYLLWRKRPRDITLISETEREREQFFIQGSQDLQALSDIESSLQNIKIKKSVCVLITLGEKIIAAAKQKTETFPQARQFLSYYLPVIKKVLLHYRNIEYNALHSAEAQAFEHKLIGFLADARLAFQAQLQRLFEGDMQDASVEIDAMKTAWYYQGLLDDRAFNTATLK